MSKNTDNTAKADAKKADEIKTVTIASIARDELEIDPKVARAKMRRIYRAEDAPKDLPKPVKEGSWTFDAKFHDQLVEMLTA